MTKNNQNVNVFADGNYAVWTSALGVAMPTTLPPTAPGTGWYEIGLLSDAGITEAHTYNENKIFDLAGSLVRIARTQEERPFTFVALEGNDIVDTLRYPGSSVSTSGATAEVQTVTMTGTGTAGTWNLVNSRFGTVTGLAYNIATTALVTAIASAWDITVGVTGTAGSSYVITFPTAAGDVPLSTAVNNITGVTAIAVATTTPGVTGVNTRAVGPGLARNLRQFAIDVVDGGLHKRVLLANGEAVWTGTTTYSGSAAAQYQFTVQAYKDISGNYYNILDDNAADAEVFA
jgi:hypothetical protein